MIRLRKGDHRSNLSVTIEKNEGAHTRLQTNVIRDCERHGLSVQSAAHIGRPFPFHASKRCGDGDGGGGFGLRGQQLLQETATWCTQMGVGMAAHLLFVCELELIVETRILRIEFDGCSHELIAPKCERPLHWRR